MSGDSEPSSTEAQRSGRFVRRVGVFAASVVALALAVPLARYVRRTLSPKEREPFGTGRRATDRREPHNGT